jgi:MinD-like ATPase involved in chromosome partitioning or flagellar assembly
MSASAFAPNPAGEPSRRGTVVSIWGPAGAPGRTTLAINVAAEIAATGASVVLADVDTYSGSVAPALGMLDESPGFAAACRLAGSDALTIAELERIGQRYRSGRAGFWVLTGLGRPGRWPELSASRVASTLDTCRTWVDYTVVDAGFSLEQDEEISSDLFAPRRNAAALTSLREADRVIAVGAADPVGLSRFLRAHVDLVEIVASGRIIVAMNKLRSSAIGLNPSGQVAQTLERFGGIDSAVMIPYDSLALDGAILSGRTLADSAPKSHVRAAIRDMVDSRLLPVSPERRSRRLLRLARH